VTVAGAAVMLGALAGLVFFLLNRPTPPTSIFPERAIYRDADHLTLLASCLLWERLRTGPGTSPLAGKEYLAALKTYRIPKDATIDEAYAAAMKQYRIRMGVTTAILVVAVAITVVGWMSARGHARETAEENDTDDVSR
jgi:hypothetical protein